jgi:rhamnosyl/mannosyltransferase
LLNGLLALVGANGLKDRVRIISDVNDLDLAEYYKNCDIFVLPSITRNEAFGIVQLEAFFYNKPVISTLIPGSGVSWVNKNNKTGKVVIPMNEYELVNAILEISGDKKFGIDKHTYVKEHFSIDVIATQILELYRDL